MLTRYRETVRGWTDPIGHALFRLRLRPNHLTLMGLGVSLGAAGAFVAGQTRAAGVLVLVAGLFDFFDGSLARASGQVTPFGAFLDSVIDRYSDLVVLLGIVVLFASLGERLNALVAMAGLVGSVMVSYTKARAESIGVKCNVGFMERPERMICLIAGALLDRLPLALWVLAVLANLTAIHRIVFTWKNARQEVIFRALVAAALLAAPTLAFADSDAERTEAGRGEAAPARTEAPARWARAVEAHQHGDSGALVHEFGSDAALRSPIADHVRYVLADALERRGDVGRARAMAVSIADLHRDSRLGPAGLLLAATLAARQGDDAASRAALTRLIETYPDSLDLPEALYLLGMTAEASGRPEDAAFAYRELSVLAPASGWADGASDRLARLAAGGIAVPRLSLERRLDRAERLLRGGVPATAAEEAERVASEASDSSIALRALRIVADAAQRLGRHEIAAKTLELAVGRAPSAEKPALRLAEARLLARGKQRDKALAVFATVITTGSEAEAAEAAWERARLLDEFGKSADATTAYRAIAQRYPTREVAGAALWRLGWLAYLKGDARGAGETWSRLAELSGSRVYRPAALYWTGRAREATSGAAAATRFYSRVLAETPRSYYGLLAAKRVGTPEGGERRRAIDLPSDPAAAIANDPGYARVDLLRRIGLAEYALAELADVVQRSVADPVRLYALTSAYVRAERYHLALRILRRHFATVASTGDPKLPQAFWEMLYPFGWRDTVTQAALREGLDVFLVAAIVREESSYYPRAVSRAGARGLMQLMPATARLVAERRGVELAEADGLDDPGVNVTLGTKLLTGMVKEFGDPRLAIAAYNAGPSRVHKWWKTRRTDDVEAWVEQIPFDETRQYVKRVMLSWDEYKRIYGGSH